MITVKAVIYVICFFSLWIIAEKVITYLRKIAESLSEISEHFEGLNDLTENKIETKNENI